MYIYIKFKEVFTVGFCGKCGVQNDDNSKFCFSCGQPLEIQSSDALEQSGIDVNLSSTTEQINTTNQHVATEKRIDGRSSNSKLIFVLVIVAVVVLIYYFFPSIFSSKPNLKFETESYRQDYVDGRCFNFFIRSLEDKNITIEQVLTNGEKSPDFDSGYTFTIPPNKRRGFTHRLGCDTKLKEIIVTIEGKNYKYSYR
jgi:hypothetical protein